MVRVLDDQRRLAAAAATDAASCIRRAIKQRGHARIVAATGASQIVFLDALVREPEVEWDKVEMFHLDEYIGLSIDHPASFRKYLLERLIGPAGIAHYHLLDGEHDAAAVCRDVGRLLQQDPVDVALVGIGENGHLAFNEPPAQFDTGRAMQVVTLARASRRQQIAEGHFESLRDVPKTALTLTIPTLLKPAHVLAVVPGLRKAQAVGMALNGPVSPDCPASILRTVPNARLYLDANSASEVAGLRLPLSGDASPATSTADSISMRPTVNP